MDYEQQKEDKVFDYEGSENWKSRSDVGGIKEMAMRLFNKALLEGAKEMTQGGVFERVINGEIINVAIFNQREIFINSVQMIKATLLPKIKKSSMKKDFKDNEDSLKQLQIKHDKSVEDLQKNYINFLDNPSPNTEHKVIEYNKKLNILVNELELNKVEIHKELLNCVSNLMEELKYFEESGAGGK